MLSEGKFVWGTSFFLLFSEMEYLSNELIVYIGRFLSLSDLVTLKKVFPQRRDIMAMLLFKNGSVILEKKRRDIMKLKYSIHADEVLNDLCLQVGLRSDFLKGVTLIS